MVKTYHEVCYVGNDINDLECMKFVGLSCAVKDAHPEVLRIPNSSAQFCLLFYRDAYRDGISVYP